MVSEIQSILFIHSYKQTKISLSQMLFLTFKLALTEKLQCLSLMLSDSGNFLWCPAWCPRQCQNTKVAPRRSQIQISDRTGLSMRFPVRKKNRFCFDVVSQAELGNRRVPFSVCSMICRTAFLRLFALHIRASRGLNIACK